MTKYRIKYNARRGVYYIQRKWLFFWLTISKLEYGEWMPSRFYTIESAQKEIKRLCEIDRLSKIKDVVVEEYTCEEQNE